MATTCARGGPRDYCAQQQRRCNRESQDYRAAPRSRYCGFGIGDCRVYASFGVWAGQTRNSTYHLHEICVVLAAHSGVARRRQKNSSCFSPFLRKVDVCGASNRPEQPIDLIAQQGLGSTGASRSNVTPRRRERRASQESCENQAKDDGKRPRP